MATGLIGHSVTKLKCKWAIRTLSGCPVSPETLAAGERTREEGL